MAMKYALTFLAFVLIIPSADAQDNEQDWPNIKKYSASNAEIVSSKKFPEVVFMGNSITEGWYNQKQIFFQKNNFAGRGIGGQTTPQMLIRFTPDVIDLKPKAVVILAGTNDIAGNTGYASTKMILDNIMAMACQSKQYQGDTMFYSSGIQVFLESRNRSSISNS